MHFAHPTNRHVLILLFYTIIHYRDAIIVCWLDCATSVFGGFVVFSVLGFMAKDAGTTVDKIVASGTPRLRKELDDYTILIIISKTLMRWG